MLLHCCVCFLTILLVIPRDQVKSWPYYQWRITRVSMLCLLVRVFVKFAIVGKYTRLAANSKLHMYIKQLLLQKRHIFHGCRSVANNLLESETRKRKCRFSFLLDAANE